MGTLVADLDELVDGGGLLFAQNGAPGILDGYPDQGVEPLIDHLDGWNREDVTWTYDFDQAALREEPARRPPCRARGARARSVASGLETTATDYVDIADGFSQGECDAVDECARCRGPSRTWPTSG